MQEQFRISVSKHSFTNRAERAVVDYMIALTKDPLFITIENLRALAIQKAQEFAKYGKVTITDLQVHSSYVCAEHIQMRRFGILGNGRKISKLVIYETIDKDSKNDFKPAPENWRETL